MPYPNEHAFRINDPSRYKRIRRTNNKFGEGISAIWGVLDNGKVELQAIRFDAGKFTFAQAKKWIRDHSYKPLESVQASGSQESVTLHPQGPGKPLEEMVKGSLEYSADEIRRAFRKAYPSTEGEWLYIEDTFADFLIVNSQALDPDEFYKVPYSRDGEGNFVFAARPDWDLVQLTYQPMTAAADEAALAEAMAQLAPPTGVNESAEGRGAERPSKRLEERIEGRITLVESDQSGGPKRLRIEGLMQADVINGNGRRYPRAVLEAAVSHLRNHLHESAGQGRLMLTGEAEHPSDKGNKRPQFLETVVRWDSVEMDDGKVNASGVLIPTSKGRDVQTLMEHKVAPGGSVRGYYDSVEKTESGRTFEEVKACIITGIDLVGGPSFNNVAEFLESQQETEDAMNLEELKKLLSAHPELLEGLLKEPLEKMGADQLKKLEETVRAKLGIDGAADLGKALQEAAEAKKKLADQERLVAITTEITTLTKDLPYGPKLNQLFVETVQKTHFASAGEVKPFVEAKRAEYDAIVASQKLASMGFKGIEVVGPVIEKAGVVPEMYKGYLAFTESLQRIGAVAKRDLTQPKSRNELYYAELLKRFDSLFHLQLLKESKSLEEAELSTDLSLPYSVSRTVIAAVVPQLVAVGLFDFGVTDQSPTKVFYEEYVNETGVDVTAAVGEGVTADHGNWVALAHQRLKVGTVVVKNHAEDTTYTEGTDYVIDYANGKIMSLSTGAIAEGDIHVGYHYWAIRKGENAPIERGAMKLNSKTLEIAADRLATQITSEAIVFSRSQIGWDATSRTLQALIREIRTRIDQGVFYLAIAAAVAVASNSGGTWNHAADPLDDLVTYIGTAKVLLQKRYYEPTGIVMSSTVANELSNWQGFTAAGKFPGSDLQETGYIGRLKGLPVFESTEFSDDYVLVANRELVAHRVYQPMALKGPFPSYDITTLKLVAADQWYAEEYNGTTAPVNEKGSYVKRT